MSENNEYEKWYKQAILENMIQAARLETLGYFIEDGRNMLIGFNDREMYKEHFIKQALAEAENLLRLKTAEIDYEP